MTGLTQEQKQRAVQAMREYVNAPAVPDGMTRPQAETKLDASRVEVIERDLRPLLTQYLDGTVPLTEFKSRVDGINKRYENWGFKGIKGQMFFNMAMNVATDPAEFDVELKAAIAAPANEEMARSRIRTFSSYIKRVGEQYVDAGGSKSGRPKVGSVVFFLSYFWQIEERSVWPIYYTNSVNMLSDLNLWHPSDDLADDYIQFKHIHEELVKLFTETSGRPFGLYDVEHVFWFKGGKPYGQQESTSKPESAAAPAVVMDEELALDAESYVPPIVAVLPRMAQNDSTSAAAAGTSGTSLERAFEKSINAAFTILGYETKLLGQGQGRAPDGLAFEGDNSYAIIWDAKVRADGYSLGTDDRAMREYITTQSRELKGRRWRNIYYLIISSRFKGEYDDIVRNLKMETGVSEVCFVEAEALVAMVDAKLRDPLQITLGPDGLQRLLSSSGVLTSANVRDLLG